MHSLQTIAALNDAHEVKARLRNDVELAEDFLTAESDECCLLFGVLDPDTRHALRRMLALSKKAL